MKRHLDATGTLCPLPILMTAREIAKIEIGEQLEVTGDDPGILEDMPAWCSETGHRLVQIEEADGRIVCLLEKADQTKDPPKATRERG